MSLIIEAARSNMRVEVKLTAPGGKEWIGPLPVLLTHNILQTFEVVVPLLPDKALVRGYPHSAGAEINNAVHEAGTPSLPWQEIIVFRFT